MNIETRVNITTRVPPDGFMKNMYEITIWPSRELVDDDTAFEHALPLLNQEIMACKRNFEKAHRGARLKRIVIRPVTAAEYTEGRLD